ncbi:hypothetical protein GBAR_LOCUS26042 [Geodia barretti]|uniref:Uncharacterized protein n=2 Tax=Geodia barretti TaxID=519541 RepID=A0AA35THN5_GEOBA|nr:hypothetical protein GBAR_LOCUS26042 [Geodia barretti]
MLYNTGGGKRELKNKKEGERVISKKVTSTEGVFQLVTMASSSRMTTELDKLVYIEMAGWKLYRLDQKHNVNNFKLHHQGQQIKVY